MGILEFREKRDQEGFQVFLACLDQMDHLGLRVTEEYQVTLDLLEWEWRDLLDPLDQMGHLDHLAQESQGHRDSEDPLENTVVVECLVAQDLWARLATASFVKHLRCRLTEGDKRKDKHELNDHCKANLRMKHVCRKLTTTAEVVTNVICLTLHWGLAVDTLNMMVLVIFVTNVLLLFIFHLCSFHISSYCKLVPFNIVARKYLCFNTGENIIKQIMNF